jgi:predicted DNA binding CopG/RHH family protein
MKPKRRAGGKKTGIRSQKNFRRSAANGTLKRRTAMGRAIEAASTVQLDPSDISKACALAEKRGLDYQAYMQTLIHEALEREEN